VLRYCSGARLRAVLGFCPCARPPCAVPRFGPGWRAPWAAPRF